ncbi:tRNA (cytidine(34)-2'-O)-methyltransferase [Calidifontibacter sp. DB0510]|uniref:Putative tRNA (cytidine(34)-2'-O)-methyltransferase n=1 Tax=Metallococcus carri TaxID=1656884 RepID=A0A967B6H9_9MICO|nr:tRNA (cytidine(34)-2'-O)-methyltransferase [Metallococcus carri]NHN55586.1 tRNA (cytidine(34)-2'-O)-methyltransferase [Metallococcus carri]NOP38230.1 tRNA (cytidine(34)-2'-O)-methyltransferase [Calidifontibacter sp. DB2511S]
MLHVVLHEPQIPPNTGNAIRLAACTGVSLHLVEPLGFTLADNQLRRAGLDYHDLAQVSVHPDFDSCMASLPAARVFAFTAGGQTAYTDISYQPGDVLLFGREADGLPEPVQQHPRVTQRVVLPMLPGRRSLNLSNCVAVAVYEAWRQHGFAPPS